MTWDLAVSGESHLTFQFFPPRAFNNIFSFILPSTFVYLLFNLFPNILDLQTCFPNFLWVFLKKSFAAYIWISANPHFVEVYWEKP